MHLESSVPYYEFRGNIVRLESKTKFFFTVKTKRFLNFIKGKGRKREQQKNANKKCTAKKMSKTQASPKTRRKTQKNINSNSASLLPVRIMFSMFIVLY